MSEKIIAMAFMRMREAGKVSDISWEDIVAHDPTGRLAHLRGLARKEALESATRRCGIGRRPRTDIYDFLDVRVKYRRAADKG